MRRYILTGTPGAGKTAILRHLETLGYDVVEEAATAVIALEHARGEDETRQGTAFIDKIVALQRRRQERASVAGGHVQFYDRSPVCTWALSRYVGLAISTSLAAEMDRIALDDVYDRRVFFVRNIGRCEPTAARRITFEGSLRFERIHEETYLSFGYELVDVPPAAVAERASRILDHASTVDTATPCRGSTYRLCPRSARSGQPPDVSCERPTRCLPGGVASGQPGERGMFSPAQG